jgi:hypothetical protein
VAGLMPHPERASESILGCADGRLVFESLIQFLEGRQGKPAQPATPRELEVAA